MIRQGAFSVSEKPPFVPDTYRTPGYPAFLAALKTVSSSNFLPTLAQFLIDIASAVVVLLACLELAGPSSWAWTAALLYALDPVASAHAGLILSEGLFGFLMILCVCALIKARHSAGTLLFAFAGACLGAAIMVRPIALYLILPWTAALAAVSYNSYKRKAVAFLIAASLLPLAWCARNAALFGHFEYTSISGASMLLWDAPAVAAAVDGKPAAQATKELQRDFLREYPNAFANPFEESSARRAFARKILLPHPFVVLRMHGVTMVKMLLGPGTDLIADVLFPGRRPEDAAVAADRIAGTGTLAILRAIPLLWILLVLGEAALILAYALGAVGLWRTAAERDWYFAAAVVLPACYLIALSSGGWAYYRFRVPISPLIALLAARGFRQK